MHGAKLDTSTNIEQDLTMSILFIANTIGTIGKLLVSYMAIRVHYSVWTEKHIDEKVFEEMKMEATFGVLGVLLIIIGYAIEAGVEFGVI